MSASAEKRELRRSGRDYSCRTESLSVQAGTQHTALDPNDPKAVSGQEELPRYTPGVPPGDRTMLITDRSLLPRKCPH